VTESPSGGVERELERARAALVSARILVGAGQFADAISRAYYAMFHAACALLASIGRTVRTHDGLRALIAEHFIRPGRLAHEHGRALSRMAGDRGEADYNVAAVFSEADVREDIALAEKFLAAVELLVAPPAP
jgi:uncharacterized protein (UPF0332 family)